MFEALFVAALLTVSDPVGDVVGDGSLEPPSAAVYRNLAPFDLREVTLTDDPQLTLTIEMGSLSDPFDLPLGFSLPVIEVYISGGEGGQSELLPGSGMRLPPGQGWQVAVRLTGEQATVYRVGSGPRGIESAPAAVTVDGGELLVTTPFPRPERPRLYAITGLYDLFGATPWRPVEPRESPWAFSSDTQQLPVLDVLAQNQAAQVRAIETGVLTPAGSRGSLPGTIWLVLMALGLLVALTGVAVRVAARPRDGGPEFETGDAVGTADADVPGAAWGSDQERAAAEDEGGTAPEPGPGTALRPFTWDSSALLTEPDDDEEFAEEFEHEFGRSSSGQAASKYAGAGDAWQRPVPLPFTPAGRVTEPISHDEEEPEVVRDEAEEVTGTGEDATAIDTASEADLDAKAPAGEAQVRDEAAAVELEDEESAEGEPADDADDAGDEDEEDHGRRLDPDGEEPS